MSEKLFETVRTLADMKRSLAQTALAELRDGNKPNFRERIEKIKSSWPSNPYETRVSSVGGGSKIFVQGRRRVYERHAYPVSAHYLHFDDDSVHSVAIYPFGLAGVTQDGRPVFQNPDSSTMRSVVLELPLTQHEPMWLQKPVESLFNIDQDGTVLARINDQPTPTELQLLEDIVQRFEVAC